MSLAIFLLSVYGLASVIATLGIGQPLRALAEKIGPKWTKRWKNADGTKGEYPTTFWYALVTCPPCLSYWIGQAFSLWLFSPSLSLIHHAGARYIAAEVDGFMACGATFVLHYLSVETVHALVAMTGAMKMTDTHEVVPKADTLPLPKALNPAIAEILRLNPTPEAPEKILATQERWESNEAKKAFTAALVELKRDLPHVLSHDKDVDYPSDKGGRVKYSYTSLAGITREVNPLLVRFGLSLDWDVESVGGNVSVVAILRHRAGHEHRGKTLVAPPDSKGGKSAAQAVESTATTLKRATALAILGLSTDADAEEADDAGAEATKPPLETGTVDTARNMKAVTAIIKAGKTKAQAEEYVKRAVKDWTLADLDKLRGWIKVQPPPSIQREKLNPQAHCGGESCLLLDPKKCACSCDKCAFAGKVESSS